MQISATQTAEAGWDEEAFAQWATGAVAVQRLLHQLAFTACILFGLKPESAYLEKRIVEWHWREATRVCGIGQVRCLYLDWGVLLLLVDPRRCMLCAVLSAQTWNLLGAEWWRKWCDYVSMDPKNGSPYGSLPVPQIPLNTVVEAARNIRGNIALRAASFSGDANSSQPPRLGPITNWSLLMQSGSRRLKQKLVLARDFYVSALIIAIVVFCVSLYHVSDPIFRVCR